MNDYKDWDKLQSLDLAVREAQLQLSGLTRMYDIDEILAYNTHLEDLRSSIHSKMDFIHKAQKKRDL